MQLARLVSFGLSLYTTFVLNEPVTRLLHERIAPAANVNLLHGVAYVAVFLTVYITLFALSRLLYRVIRASKLEMLDRIAGAVLGALKMSLILAPICLVLPSLPATEESTIAPLMAHATREAMGVLPDSYRNQADESVELVRIRARPWIAQ